MEQKNLLVEFWRQHFGFSEPVLNAFREIERVHFVPEELRHLSYEDVPLMLLRGKTISQPTTVMIMTSALELSPGDKVFEVGTGSGYQAAIIAKIVGPEGKVISTEVIPELVSFARDNLRKAGIANVEVHEADGSKGMESQAPFDRIIITAACREFPKELLGQLKADGIIVGPVGNRDEQSMVRAVKDKSGRFSHELLGPFMFTPMYGKYGFEL